MFVLLLFQQSDSRRIVATHSDLFVKIY